MMIAYLDVCMECMVSSGAHMHSWVPVETSLPRQKIVLKYLSCMTTLLQSEPSTGRVLLVVGRSSHDLGGERHGLAIEESCSRCQVASIRCLLNKMEVMSIEVS